MKKLRLVFVAALCAFVMFAFAACNTGDDPDKNGFPWWIWLVFAGLLVVFFVPSYFNRKKQREQVNTMMSGLKPGAKIKTIGGIVGEVIEIRSISMSEKHIVIRTGVPGSETTLTMDINSVGMIMKDPAAAVSGEPETPDLPSDEEVARLMSGDAAKTEEAPVSDTSAVLEEAPKEQDDGAPPFDF